MKVGQITISAAVAILCFGAQVRAINHRNHNLIAYEGRDADMAEIAADKDIQAVISKARAEAKAEFNKQEDMATTMDQKRWRDTEFRHVQQALLKTIKDDSPFKYELTKDRNTQVAALLSYYDLILGYDK